MYAVKAIYDGTNFKLEEPAPVKGIYEVLIAFLNMVDTVEQTQETVINKQYTWLSGNSGIDNPVKVGENFRKYSREELYDR